ncbi:MAG TPA: hypothetical protein VN416_01465, partial [Desulfomonilia bacterium]|nr:hypothetical protein [Desulfomonilia bacterium]
IMKPHIHYIPLKKDFSNFHEVITAFSDPQRRRDISEQAHKDLIASGSYSYISFIREFDDHLLSAGLSPRAIRDRQRVDRPLMKDFARRYIRTLMAQLVYVPFPGKRHLRALVRKILRNGR